MRVCPDCNATSPAGSAWCGQCFAPLSTESDAPGAARPLVTAAAVPAEVSHFALPATATTERFGVPFAAQPVSAVITPAADVRPPVDGPMLSGKAIALVITAICIGALGMGVSWLLGRDSHMEPATYIRYALVLTIGVYVVVGALIAIRLVPGVRLRWHTGKPATSILIGAACGGVLSALLLAVVSKAAGHLAPDPRVVTMMSEGDVAHIVAAIAITCLAAPLIEEILFRGLLLESLRRQGGRVALWVSGVAFAVWHLNPSALRYYALMGVFLGVLYMKRGLVCSMAAHAAFNGVLTVAALAVVLAPARTVTAGDLSFSAPRGWGQLHAVGSGWVLDGPSAAEVFVGEQAVPVTPSSDQIYERVRTGLTTVPIPGVSFDATTVRKTVGQSGVAVEVDLNYEGHGGTMAMLSEPGKLVEMVILNAGSTKAQSDFPHMLDSLRVG